MGGVAAASDLGAVLPRIDLWADAWEILRTSPLIRQGPGSYAELSPTAADPDTRAAHSVLMQVLAELGVVGALILAAVAGLALVHGAPNRVLLVGVAAWVALWMHGLIDYVMQFPPVLLVGGLVLGAAASAPKAARDSPA